MDINSQKCLGCGATLKYNPKTKNFKCEYCNSEYTIDDIEKMQKDSKLRTQSKNINVNCGTKIDKEYDTYLCPNCGAELITDGNTAATSCVYCKSTAIIKNRTSGLFLPNKLIPFSKTKEDAINAFKSCTNKKLFAPKEFSNMKNLKEVTGVYIPFWLYDSVASADFDASGSKVRSWSSGNYHYTETSIYNVERSGSMEFEDVPVDASTKFEDDLMDSIEPYDYSKLVEYNDAYLSGFLAEKYDVNKEDASSRMETRVASSAIEKLKSTATNYSTLTPKNQNVQIEKGEIEYVMLPVYMLNILYKNKLYHFAMNGDTGKFIGEIPIDKGKAWMYSLIFFVVLLGIALGICVLV